jgi:hypothetical protein
MPESMDEQLRVSPVRVDSGKACAGDCKHNTSGSSKCSGHNPDLDNSYPRSRTMSFLPQQPVLMIRLLWGLTNLPITRQTKATRISRERGAMKVAKCSGFRQMGYVLTATEPTV